MKLVKRIVTFLKKPETIIFCILMVALALYYNMYFNSPHKTFPEAYYGEPTVSIEYPQIDISIDQVVEVGQYLYVLHHHSNGIVQVYDLTGAYQHTLFFYCHTKGGFSLATDGYYLYVEDMRGNVYALKDGEFDHFLEKSEAKKQLVDMDFRSLTSSVNYEIRTNAIWRITEDGEQCIIESSKPNGIFVDSLSILVPCTFIIVMLYQRRKSK